MSIEKDKDGTINNITKLMVFLNGKLLLKWLLMLQELS